MKVIYDSKAPAESRCIAIGNDGKEFVCGCFDIKLEVTDLETGKGSEKVSISGWGTVKERDARHTEVSKLVREQKGPL